MRDGKLRKRLILFAGLLSLMGKPDMRVEALKKWDCNLEDQENGNKVGKPRTDENEKQPKKNGITETTIGKYVGGTIVFLLVGGVIGRGFWKKRQGKEKDRKLETTKTDDVKNDQTQLKAKRKEKKKRNI